MYKRIALVGASSTGKTTVYELLKSHLKSPPYGFVTESTRSVRDAGFNINEDGTDNTQLAISSFHLEVLTHPGPLIMDRCYLDLLIYTENLPDVSEEVKRFIRGIWKRIKSQYTHFVYFPIEFKTVADGVRSENEEWRVDIDKGFKEALNQGLNYIEVTGSPMERLAQILNFIDNEEKH